jgi:hypothetical protein
LGETNLQDSATCSSLVFFASEEKDISIEEKKEKN